MKKICIFAMLLIGIVIQTDFINASGFEVISPLRYRLTALNEAGITFNIMKTEIWKDIKGYKNKYQISNLGRIKSINTKIITYGGKRAIIIPNKIRIPQIKRGYFQIALNKNKKIKYVTIHRLVAQAFIPNPENKPQINHKNCIKTDNYVDNIEWCTLSENMQHAYRNGLMENVPKGEKCHTSKLNKKKILEIREIYKTNKYTHEQISQQYGVIRQTITSIVNKKTWKHL